MAVLDIGSVGEELVIHARRSISVSMGTPPPAIIYMLFVQNIFMRAWPY
jgi:hypothetical protein